MTNERKNDQWEMNSNETMENEQPPTFRNPRIESTLRSRRLPFRNLPADRFVFHFACFVDGDVLSASVGNSSFLAVDVCGWECSQRSGSLRRIEAGVIDARMIDGGQAR